MRLTQAYLDRSSEGRVKSTSSSAAKKCRLSDFTKLRPLYWVMLASIALFYACYKAVCAEAVELIQVSFALLDGYSATRLC